MNWKLIIITSLAGTLAGVVLGYLIFFGFPQLSNFNVEEYLGAGILASAGVAAFLTYRCAVGRKFLHAAIVFAAVCLLPVLFFVLLVLFVLLFCNFIECKIIPF